LLALLCILVLIIVGPISQNQNYHHFADDRKLGTIPNFLNVITNLPFAIVGLLGLRAALNIKDGKLKNIFSTLFYGFLLLTLGSGYYHWMPQNDTLVYDRIPIVVILMSFFAFVIYACVDKSVGYKAFFAFNIIGVLSVIYWAFSESMGKGDLRWYGMVQFFPIIAIPLILILYRSSSEFRKEILFIFLFFGLAKLNERFDREIYHLVNNTISGHSLKHLFMVAAGYKIVVIGENCENRLWGVKE
jgi:hypothetical protein